MSPTVQVAGEYVLRDATFVAPCSKTTAAVCAHGMPSSANAPRASILLLRRASRYGWVINRIRVDRVSPPGDMLSEEADREPC